MLERVEELVEELVEEARRSGRQCGCQVGDPTWLERESFSLFAPPLFELPPPPFVTTSDDHAQPTREHYRVVRVARGVQEVLRSPRLA